MQSRNFSLIQLLIVVSLIISVVNCDDADEEEKKITKEIGDNICKDDDRANDWYNCMMCCQGLNPYELKKKTECNLEARKKKYGEPKLTKDTKDQMCGDMSGYAQELKNIVLDLKGDIKSCCATDDGLKDFFQKKLDCFRACEEDGGYQKNKDAGLCK